PVALLSLHPPPQPASTLFPYTTLFRSQARADAALAVGLQHGHAADPAPLAGLSGRGLFERHQPAGADRVPLVDGEQVVGGLVFLDRKSTRLNSSHLGISYAVFCLKKKI